MSWHLYFVTTYEITETNTHSKNFIFRISNSKFNENFNLLWSYTQFPCECVRSGVRCGAVLCGTCTRVYVYTFRVNVYYITIWALHLISMQIQIQTFINLCSKLTNLTHRESVIEPYHADFHEYFTNINADIKLLQHYISEASTK